MPCSLPSLWSAQKNPALAPPQGGAAMSWSADKHQSELKIRTSRRKRGKKNPKQQPPTPYTQKTSKQKQTSKKQTNKKQTPKKKHKKTQMINKCLLLLQWRESSFEESHEFHNLSLLVTQEVFPGLCESCDGMVVWDHSLVFMTAKCGQGGTSGMAQPCQVVISLLPSLGKQLPCI